MLISRKEIYDHDLKRILIFFFRKNISLSLQKLKFLLNHLLVDMHHKYGTEFSKEFENYFEDRTGYKFSDDLIC